MIVLFCRKTNKLYIYIIAIFWYFRYARLRNILTSFDEFETVDSSILSVFDLQNYQSHYLNLRDTVRKRVEEDKVSILDDITFETELVDHVSINIDYILDLIEKYHKTNCKDDTLIQKMFLAVSSSLPLRSKKELIELFYHQVNLDEKPIGELWMEFVREQKDQDLQRIISKKAWIRKKRKDLWKNP